jgi:hypothetical protein
MFRLSRMDDIRTFYPTGEVRYVRDPDGGEFVAVMTDDEKDAALFPSWNDANGFRLRLALEGFRIEEAEDERLETGSPGAAEGAEPRRLDRPQ